MTNSVERASVSDSFEGNNDNAERRNSPLELAGGKGKGHFLHHQETAY